MKEIKITPPEGYVIDRENSTFECIKFNPIIRWRDNTDAITSGSWIGNNSEIKYGVVSYVPNNYNVFATEKQAKSALAMARISQIMDNDPRFGGVITDEEWKDKKINKYSICRINSTIEKERFVHLYTFLAFHTKEQRDLFLKENEDLVKDYLMIP